MSDVISVTRLYSKLTLVFKKQMRNMNALCLTFIYQLVADGPLLSLSLLLLLRPQLSTMGSLRR